MANIYKLFLKTGDEKNKPYLIDKDKNTIGRDPLNDFVIDDIEISRTHLLLTKKEDAIFIEDLNSTNGTFLNGKRLNKLTKAKNGDLISLGKNIDIEFVQEKISDEPELNELDKLEPQPQNSLEQELSDEKSSNEKSLDQEQIEQENLDNDTLGKGELDNKDHEQETETTRGVDKKEKVSNLRKSLKRLPTWSLILIITLGFLVIFCVIPILVIEFTNQWCNMFAGFFNSMSPGVCL